MKLLLGSLLLAQICCLGAEIIIPILRNLNIQRIAKAWYPLLTIPTGQQRHSAFPPFRFQALPNGNLKYIIRVPKNGICTTEEVVMNRYQVTGDYFNTGVPSTLRFAKTDYNTYFIAYTSMGQTYENTFLVLAGTQPTVTSALQRRFREAANSMGVTGEIVHNVPQATC